MRNQSDNEKAGPAGAERKVEGAPSPAGPMVSAASIEDHPTRSEAARAGGLKGSRRRPATAQKPGDISGSLSKVLRPQAAYRWLLPQLAAITPRYVEMTLRGALAGNHVQAWELFDLMEDTSPRLMKNLNELKRAVIGLDWQMFPWRADGQPPTESARARARLVEFALKTMRPDPVADENDFSGALYDVLDAWGKGQSVQEVEWEARELEGFGSILAPRATYWVHPTCVSWDLEGRLGLRVELTGNATSPTSDLKRVPAPLSSLPARPLTPGVWQTTSMQPRPSQVAAFPPHKFLVSICKAKSGTALGGALLRPLAWWWCAANFSAEWLMDLAELFGLPFRWASFQPGTPQATVDQICEVLNRMGHQGWAAFPANTEVQLIEPARHSGQSAQGDLLDRAEKQMDLLILGQTLTTDVSKQGGSRALGEVHAGVKAEIVQAAGNFAATVLRQLVRSVLVLNFGEDREAPEFRPAPAPLEDPQANADRDVALLGAGVAMPRAWFYARHGIPVPSRGEEVVGGGEAGGGGD